MISEPLIPCPKTPRPEACGPRVPALDAGGLRTLWLELQVQERKVEPNSALGEAITYLRMRWLKLTLFLREPGAPLDNNSAERVLKKAILNRKNAMFFKSEHGATVGDVFMSLIHTGEQHGVNPFEYLSVLLSHPRTVAAFPTRPPELRTLAGRTRRGGTPRRRGRTGA